MRYNNSAPPVTRILAFNKSVPSRILIPGMATLGTEPSFRKRECDLSDALFSVCWFQRALKESAATNMALKYIAPCNGDGGSMRTDVCISRASRLPSRYIQSFTSLYATAMRPKH